MRDRIGGARRCGAVRAAAREEHTVGKAAVHRAAAHTYVTAPELLPPKEDEETESEEQEGEEEEVPFVPSGSRFAVLM